MKFDTEYKKQINNFCESINMPDPDEMLKLAKARAAADNITERTEITMTKNNRKKINRFTVIAAITAASLAASAASVYAYSNGGFSALFGNIFHDEVASSLVEQGYITEHDIANTDGIFDARLTAVAGDVYNPTLVFDIRVNDPELAAEYDTMEIDSFVLDEEDYDKYKSHYGTFSGTGYRDEEDPTLYHVSLWGGWSIVNSKRGVADIVTIRLVNGDDVQDYDVDMEFRFDIPEGSLKNVDCVFIDNTFVTYKDMDIQLGTFIYDNYETMFDFFFMLPDSYFEGMDPYSNEVYFKLNDDFREFADTMVLTVDGVDYSPKTGKDSTNACYDPAYLPGTFNAHGDVYFPAIDYENSQNVTLTIDGTVIELKTDGRNRDNNAEGSRWYEYDISTTFDDTDFKVSTIMFSTDGTEVTFKYYAPEKVRSKSYEMAQRALDAQWQQLLSTITVEVDGVLYETTSTAMSGVAYDPNGDYGPQWECWATAKFYGFDCSDPHTFILNLNGESIIVEDEEHGYLHNKKYDYPDEEEYSEECEGVDTVEPDAENIPENDAADDSEN